MTLDIISSLFERELNKLKNEIELYENPKRLWLVEKIFQILQVTLLFIW